MLSSYHLFPLQEVLDLLYQKREIMEPQGWSMGLLEGRFDVIGRMMGVTLPTRQDLVDLYLVAVENPLQVCIFYAVGQLKSFGCFILSMEQTSGLSAAGKER